MASDIFWWRYSFNLSDLIADGGLWYFQVCQSHSALWMLQKPLELWVLVLTNEKQPSRGKCLLCMLFTPGKCTSYKGAVNGNTAQYKYSPNGMSKSDLKCLGSTADTGLCSLLLSEGPLDTGLGLNSASLAMLYLWSAAGLSGLAGKANNSNREHYQIKEVLYLYLKISIFCVLSKNYQHFFEKMIYASYSKLSKEL